MDLDLLPRSARKEQVQEFIKLAEDLLYCIIKIDYNNGLIRFESLQNDGIFINLYSTTFTITIERNKRQKHFRNCKKSRAKKIFENPKKYINQ